MERTNTGLEIIKKAESTVAGKTVSLTRKTNLKGEIRHGVVLTSASGHHRRVATFTSIAPAYNLYRSLAKA